jgi:hypothetical protein
MVEGIWLKYGVEATLNGKTFLLNSLNMYQLVQKLQMGDAQSDRQAGRMLIQ